MIDDDHDDSATELCMLEHVSERDDTLSRWSSYSMLILTVGGHPSIEG